MGNDQYVPDGTVQGDDSGMPNKGTSTGVTDTYGADLSQGADNRMGSISKDTGSDPEVDDDAEDHADLL